MTNQPKLLNPNLSPNCQIKLLVQPQLILDRPKAFSALYRAHLVIYSIVSKTDCPIQKDH